MVFKGNTKIGHCRYKVVKFQDSSAAQDHATREGARMIRVKAAMHVVVDVQVMLQSVHEPFPTVFALYIYHSHGNWEDAIIRVNAYCCQHNTTMPCLQVTTIKEKDWHAALQKAPLACIKRKVHSFKQTICIQIKKDTAPRV